MTHSVVLIVSEPLREAANRLACALGYDALPLPGNTFARPLSADGAEPATHWGAHTWTTQSFLDVLAAAGKGALPSLKWDNYGLTERSVTDVVAGLVVSVQGVDAHPRTHWQKALATNALVPAVPPDKHPKRQS